MNFLDLFHHYDLLCRIVPMEYSIRLSQVSKNIRTCLCVNKISTVLRCSASVMPQIEVILGILQFSKVHTVDLSNSRIGLYSSSTLGTILWQGQNIVNLNLSNCCLSAGFLESLMALPLNIENVEKLSLRGNCLRGGGAVISELLIICKKLQSLDLRQIDTNTSDDRVITHTIQIKPEITNLRVCVMRGWDIDDGMHVLNLTAVNICGDAVRDWHVSSFENMLRNSLQLRSIQIAGLACNQLWMDWFSRQCMLWQKLETVCLKFHMVIGDHHDQTLLIQALSSCRHLKSVDLGGIRIGAPEGLALGGLFRNCKMLENIRPGREFGRIAIKNLSNASWTAPSLLSLDLHSMNITSDVFGGLGLFAFRCSRLRELNLGGNNLSWKSACILSNFRTLENLTIGFSGVNRSGFDAFRSYLARPNSPLTRLVVLEYGLMTDFDSLLGGATGLVDLSISRSSTPASMGKICLVPKSLFCFTRLRKLALEQMKGVVSVGGSSLTALRLYQVSRFSLIHGGTFSEIDSHVNLNKLEMSYCNIRKTGVQGLGAFIHKLSSLTVLDLYGNCIGRARFLFEGVSSSLTVLKMNSNELQDQGAMDVALSIQCLTSIKELGLSNNNIGDVGFDHLSNALFRTRNMEQVFLGRNRPATCNSSNAIQSALSGHHCMRNLVAPAQWRPCGKYMGVRYTIFYE